MSKATELANFASIINSGSPAANTLNIDGISSKKITVTDGRGGNTEFDGGNTAYPAIELLAGNPTSLTAKYTPAIKFGSTDVNLLTQNPKFGAAIVAEATQNYTTDTTGGMALSFWTSAINPGTQTQLKERLTIEGNGQITVNNAGFVVWTNATFQFATAGTGQGARIGKFTDNNLYIENFDGADILFRKVANLTESNIYARFFGANGNVRFYNSANVNQTLTTTGDLIAQNDLIVENDFYVNAGYGSASKAYGCRAWVSFYGGYIHPNIMGGVIYIYGSGNITSITDLAVGQYRANFETPMPDNNYAMCGSASLNPDNMFSVMGDDGTAPRTINNMQFHVSYVNSTGRYDTTVVDVMFFR